ncbi:ATP-binding protein [Streptomyces sp. F63]|uniref:ATP-binding protein n=1 Tax=Streptomyces sp. F63 TaxID=2824887 RepID=UPI001B35BC39|nr:ATP-binding protein [Streptomyces sp. F63]MBQ0988293.1 ATP-binding protein [Streptomyces sp. F63]
MQVLQVQLEVRPDPAEVGRARRWVRSRLAGSGVGGDESLAETLLLLVSELVTNAVVHTGRPAVLRILLPAPEGADGPGGGAGGVSGPLGPGGAGAGAAGRRRAAVPETVRVEVADRSARPPARRHVEGDETSGRGLELVDGLADRWGWRSEGAGKAIWCEVDRGESVCATEAGEPVEVPVSVPAAAPEPQCAMPKLA